MLRILRVFISVVVIIVFTISFASLFATADTAFESQQTSLSNQGSTQATMQAAAASTPQEVTALGPGKAVEREILVDLPAELRQFRVRLVRLNCGLIHRNE